MSISATGRKAQTAIEFLLFISGAFVLSIIFLAASVDDIKEIQSKRESFAVRDAAKNFQEEIVLAAQVENGYKRTFFAPYSLVGKNYDVLIINNSLTVSTEHASYSMRIPKIEGTIKTGYNNITKNDGKITLNP